MKFWVKMDPDYWASYREGTYYRDIDLFDVGDDDEENLWSCCGDGSGVPCNACNGQCHKLGLELGNSVRICVKITAGFASDQTPTHTSALEAAVDVVSDGSFEDLVSRRIEGRRSESTPWGRLKTKFR